MSAIILASGTWPSRMIWLPTWRTLTWAPGNAWLTRVSSSFESTVTRTRKETGRLLSSQRVRLVVPNDLPVTFKSRASRLIGQQLHVGDQRVGDHHTRQRSLGLDDLAFARNEGDLGLGLLDLLDQVGHIPGDLIVGPARSWAGGTRRNQASRVTPELDQLGPRCGRGLPLKLTRQWFDRDDPGNPLTRSGRWGNRALSWQRKLYRFGGNGSRRSGRRATRPLQRCRRRRRDGDDLGVLGLSLGTTTCRE